MVLMTSHDFLKWIINKNSFHTHPTQSSERRCVCEEFRNTLATYTLQLYNPVICVEPKQFIIVCNDTQLNCLNEMHL